MSLKIIHIAAKIEESDDFHVARILMLLKAAAGKNHSKPVQGIMKLAKLDFLLRYPNCLVRMLRAVGKDDVASQIPEHERDTIEGRMIRFRFGPWDRRYRRWIGILVAKNLADAYVEGKTVNVKITSGGVEVANKLASMEEFGFLAKRCEVVVRVVGGFSATKLKDFIYQIFPEILNMRWGKDIEL